MKNRIDLSALDPFADPAKRDTFVAGVMERSALELARRRRSDPSEVAWGAGSSVFTVVASWARPALAAAALAVVASGVALRIARPQAEAGREEGVLERMALPTPVEEWLVEERSPTTADLVLTLEGGTAW